MTISNEGGGVKTEQYAGWAKKIQEKINKGKTNESVKLPLLDLFAPRSVQSSSNPHLRDGGKTTHMA